MLQSRPHLLQKGTLIAQVLLDSITSDGLCVARIDGMVVFLKGGAPGDVVDAVITRRKKNFLEGYVSRVHKSSAERTEPFCAHFGLCGGCTWQHLRYEAQLIYKRQFVCDSLRRIGGFVHVDVLPTLPAEKIRWYRNRLDFTFTAAGWRDREAMKQDEEPCPSLGFHIPQRYDKVFDVVECHLQDNPSQPLRVRLRQLALELGIPFFDLRSRTGFLRTLTIRTTRSEDVMVILQVAYEHAGWIDTLLGRLQADFPQLTSIYYVVNKKLNDTFADLEMRLWGGSPTIVDYVTIPEENIALQFKIGPKSFYQTNSQQACLLYAATLRQAQLTGSELAYDLYTGVGSIASLLALRAHRVIGLEYVASAVEDARENTRLNQIDNVEFFAGDVAAMLTSDFVAQQGKPDVVVVDPPRAGLHLKVCAALCALAPRRLVYVSCNPATQARDLQLLSTRFAIESVQPIDMFPHTRHVETVAGLSLR